jgi:acetyltransferase
MQNSPATAGQQPSINQLWLAEVSLPDGRVVHFRHVQPDDQPQIEDAIRSASRETLLHRFFSPIRRVSPERLRKMLTIDRAQEACIVGVVEENGGVRIVCGARYVRQPKPRAAEIALTVHDHFQRRGLGTFLLKRLIRLGRSDGIRWFEAYVMSSNVAMLRLLQNVVPAGASWHEAGDVHRIVIDLEGLDT